MSNLPYDYALKEQVVLNRAYDDDAGAFKSKLVDAAGSDVTGLETNNVFFANHVDDYTTTSVTYVGKETKAGVYLIMKIDETGNFPVLTYASISNNSGYTTYSTAWAARTSLTYNIYSTAF